MGGRLGMAGCRVPPWTCLQTQGPWQLVVWAWPSEERVGPEIWGVVAHRWTGEGGRARDKVIHVT